MIESSAVSRDMGEAQVCEFRADLIGGITDDFNDRFASGDIVDRGDAEVGGTTDTEVGAEFDFGNAELGVISSRNGVVPLAIGVPAQMHVVFLGAAIGFQGLPVSVGTGFAADPFPLAFNILIC